MKIILLLLTILSCVKEEKTATEYIVGNIDWKPVNTLPVSDPIRVASTGVGYLQITSKRSRCTAFRVAENIIMTNNHCVRDASETKDMQYNPHFYDATFPADSWVKCDKFLKGNAQLDYSLIECEPGKLTGSVQELDPTTYTEHQVQSALMIHQNCDYFNGQCSPIKIYEDGCYAKPRFQNSWDHGCDSLGGSSGSPLFKKEGNKLKVIGLHFAGFKDNADAHLTSGRGTFNLAKKMSLIYPEVKDLLDGKITTTPPPTDQPLIKYMYPSRTSCEAINNSSFKCTVLGWRFINDTK